MELLHPALEEAKSDLTAKIAQHPFLKRCRNGEVSLDTLKRFLVQQGHYSRHFTRYLCALMSNLRSNEHVLSLADNLFEELGLTEDSPTPHSEIYKAMLERFELDLGKSTVLASTQVLIQTMFDHCRDPNPARGLGALCLGAEALVPHVYADILAGFKAVGVDATDTAFFQIHVECDDGHAETMRDIMVLTAQDDPSQLDIMISSGRHLVEARSRFFSGLLADELELEAV
jgi:pyrroloquinoline-quinone synthase